MGWGKRILLVRTSSERSKRKRGGKRCGSVRKGRTEITLLDGKKVIRRSETLNDRFSEVCSGAGRREKGGRMRGGGGKRVVK